MYFVAVQTMTAPRLGACVCTGVERPSWSITGRTFWVAERHSQEHSVVCDEQNRIADLYRVLLAANDRIALEVTLHNCKLTHHLSGIHESLERLNAKQYSEETR